MNYPCIFWNLQRLFEPRGGDIARSLGVTSNNWTQKDYEYKIRNVAACLLKITKGVQPALLGFAEVETLKIVQDLMKEAGWGDMISLDEVIPAPELKGHDVALLYNSKVFKRKPVKARSLTLNNNFHTRDLLQVQLRLRKTDKEVDIVVLHWPSRVIREGDILRMAHSFYLKNLISERLKFPVADLLNRNGSFSMPQPEALLDRWNIPFIIMGDFNDEPYDDSVREGLESSRDLRLVLNKAKLTGECLKKPEGYLASKFVLYNPCWSLRFADTLEIGGTYYNSPEWKTYDQLIVSHGLLIENSPVKLVQESVQIPRLSKFDMNSETVSMMTEAGFPKEFDPLKPTGVSDHFPLYYEVLID